MYELIYNQFGNVGAIRRLPDGSNIPLCEGNTDYQEFLIWNKAQKTPLDLNSTIEIMRPIDPLKTEWDKATTVAQIKTVLGKKLGLE